MNKPLFDLRHDLALHFISGAVLFDVFHLMAGTVDALASVFVLAVLWEVYNLTSTTGSRKFDPKDIAATTAGALTGVVATLGPLPALVALMPVLP